MAPFFMITHEKNLNGKKRHDVCLEENRICRTCLLSGDPGRRRPRHGSGGERSRADDGKTFEMTPEEAERVSPEVAAEEPPAFTEEFLNDPAQFRGREDGLGDLRRMPWLAGLSGQGAQASSEAVFSASSCSIR